MDKLKMSTPDLTDKNIEQIGMLFPNVITEVEDGTTKDTKGHEIKKYKKVVDFDLLRQMLSKNLVEDDNERYRLDWPGKKASLLKANTPITKTLRPCLEESSGKDGNPGKFDSENLYIEGDNFEVLKILQESYLGKIKMIYIDPPYNTGNDFIYKDNFAKSKDEYEEELGTTDEEGGKLFRNTDSNGRYHSDWLSMMYERLIVARDLLKDDGVIFISIDDNEVHNLRKICDEVFGEENFQGHIHWRRRHNQPNDKTKMIGLVAEHLIVFSKNLEALKISGVGKIDLTGDFSNPDNDPRGDWASKPWKVGSDQSGSTYSIKTPSGKILKEEWMGELSTYEQLLADNRIVFPRSGDGMPRKKYYRFEREEEGQCATNWWEHSMFGHNQGANDCMTDLFGVKNVFNNPKPLELLRGLIQISNAKNNDVILDFFSGSATSAHSVMQINQENSQNLKFILVQLPEDLNANYEKATGKEKAQLKVAIDFLESIKKPLFLTEIGKERIRRAGKKILDENKDKDGIEKLDIGFRVYKTDSTNMKDVFYHPSELKQDLLSGLESNIKEDRTPEDLLTQVILDLGLELTLPIETKKILGNTVFIVQTNALVACFDKDIDFNIVDTISDLKPLKVVFKDASFKDDKDRINVEERFKRLSPETKVTVI